MCSILHTSTSPQRKKCSTSIVPRQAAMMRIYFIPISISSSFTGQKQLKLATQLTFLLMGQGEQVIRFSCSESSLEPWIGEWTQERCSIIAQKDFYEVDKILRSPVKMLRGANFTESLAIGFLFLLILQSPCLLTRKVIVNLLSYTFSRQIKKSHNYFGFH